MSCSIWPLTDGLLRITSSTESLPHRPFEIGEGSANRHAANPRVRLLRVVVNEGDGIHVPVRVGAHLAHEKLAEGASSVNQYPVASLAPCRGDEIHRAERRTRGGHGHGQKERIQAKDDTRESLEPVEVHLEEHRKERPEAHSPATTEMSRRPNVSHER